LKSALPTVCSGRCWQIALLEKAVISYFAVGAVVQNDNILHNNHISSGKKLDN
jgi:hypothetical protein